MAWQLLKTEVRQMKKFGRNISQSAVRFYITEHARERMTKRTKSLYERKAQQYEGKLTFVNRIASEAASMLDPEIDRGCNNKVIFHEGKSWVFSWEDRLPVLLTMYSGYKEGVRHHIVDKRTNREFQIAK